MLHINEERPQSKPFGGLNVGNLKLLNQMNDDEFEIMNESKEESLSRCSS